MPASASPWSRTLVVLAAFVFLFLAGASGFAHGAETYVVDKSHSSVLFRVKHANVSWFFGRFIDFDGKIEFDGAEPAKSLIEITVKTESIRTWSKERDDHLRSPDFFHAAEHPTLSFQSRQVEPVGDDRYRVTGDFTMHGVTRKLSFEVEKTGEGRGPSGDTRIGFYTEFAIQRSDYGMTKYVEENMIGDEVRIYISLEAIQE